VSPELLKMVVFVTASTVALSFVILFAARLRGGRAPGFLRVVIVAALISACGVPFGKYGENFGLPWQIYYSVPALATLLVPPLLFRFSITRSIVYVLLALLSAPLIHAAFFYLLGWSEFMPFLKLPQ